MDLLKILSEPIDYNDDVLFQSIIINFLNIGFTRDQDLSNLFAISIPSVNRWKNGISSPHPLMRRHIYATLKKQLLADNQIFDLTRENYEH